MTIAVVFQVCFSRDAILLFRIPLFNSQDYIVGGVITTFAIFIVAIIFLISAARAKRAVVRWTNPAAGRVLMQRVRTSGLLMVGMTFVAGIAVRLMNNPAGFVIWGVLSFPLVQWNSVLQIDSFEPAGGVPNYLPLCSALDALRRAIITARERRIVPFVEVQSGATVFAKLTKAGELRPRKQSIVGNLAPVKKQRLYVQTTNPPSNPQNEKAPCDRLGLSLAFLEAFVQYYEITPDMTTEDVCELFIKPFTQERQCVYQDLLVDDPDIPDGWLGKTTHFASHWWVSHRCSKPNTRHCSQLTMPCPYFVS